MKKILPKYVIVKLHDKKLKIDLSCILVLRTQPSMKDKSSSLYVL
jgi:hypothetical protein